VIFVFSHEQYQAAAAPSAPIGGGAAPPASPSCVHSLVSVGQPVHGVLEVRSNRMIAFVVDAERISIERCVGSP